MPNILAFQPADIPVSSWLFDARYSNEMTQAQLASAVGVSAPTISNWERGKCSPSLASERVLRHILLTESAVAFGSKVREIIAFSIEVK